MNKITITPVGINCLTDLRKNFNKEKLEDDSINLSRFKLDKSNLMKSERSFSHREKSLIIVY